MSRQQSIMSGNNNGLVSILKQFSKSVEKLNHTILFPVRLQDIDVTSVTDNKAITEMLQNCFTNKKTDANLYELYVLLQSTRNELLTGCDAEDSPSSDSVFHNDLHRIMNMLKLLTDLSDTVRISYESSLFPPRAT